MANYVLVHGSAVGGWYWKRVAPLLQSVGHAVYTPTLTGLGERAHLFTSGISLDTHIRDIVGVLEYEDLSDVILVGHSQNTVVAAGAADRISERVAHLVYIDGPVPINGASIFDLIPEEARPGYLGLVADTAQGKALILPDVRVFGWIDEADADWFNAKATPDPVNRWSEPLTLHNEAAFTHIPKTYVAGIGTAPNSDSQPEWTAGLNYIEIPASHLMMISAPQLLANVLLELASPKASK